MQEHNAEEANAASSLLSAPGSWWRQLVLCEHLDSASKLSLFQTCRQLGERVMQLSKRTCLRLDLCTWRSKTGLYMWMLQWASWRASNVKLILSSYACKRWGQCLELCDEEVVGNPVQFCRGISFFQEAAELGVTSPVTELHLEDVWLNTPLPQAIGQACHNLTKLSVHDVRIHLCSSASVSKDFQNLQSLELRCTVWHAFDHLDTCMQRMRSQMSTLAALRSLTVVSMNHQPDVAIEFEIIHAVASQLTHLSLSRIDADWQAPMYAPRLPDMLQLGVNLQHLQLYGVPVNDHLTRPLLNMPRLTHLEVDKFDLEGSFAGQACKWEQLVCHQQVDLQTLAYLPLHPGLVLKVNMLVESTFDTEVITQAIANVQQAKGLVWGSDGMLVAELEGTHAPVVAAWITQALPLIRGLKNFKVGKGTMDMHVMQALGELVRDRTDAPCVMLEWSCGWKVVDAVALMKNMPDNSTIQVRLDDAKHAVQQIIQLCCAAQHKVTLYAHWDGYACWDGEQVREQQVGEQHIRSAIEACDLEVVSLTLCVQGDLTWRCTIMVRARHR